MHRGLYTNSAMGKPYFYDISASMGIGYTDLGITLGSIQFTPRRCNSVLVFVIKPSGGYDLCQNWPAPYAYSTNYHRGCSSVSKICF